MRGIRISVIIPIYNMGKYLSQCLDSTLGQSLKEIELLCINDGSTDNSIEILREYAARDARIRVVDRENWGVGRTRNQGIELASGEFVCFMDPDDYYPSDDILEALYRGATEHNMLICGGEFSQFSEEYPGIRQNFGKAHQGYLFDKEGIVEYRDYQYDYGYHRFVYNRKWLIENNIFFPPYARFQDPPFFVKAMVTAGSFYAIDKIVYAYRTSHKVIRWSPEKAYDMMCGITDVLQYANKYNLNKLKDYVALQFEFNYSQSRHTFDAKCKRALKRLSFSYVRRSFIDYIFSRHLLWKEQVKLITFMGIPFICDVKTKKRAEKIEKNELTRVTALIQEYHEKNDTVYKTLQAKTDKIHESLRLDDRQQRSDIRVLSSRIESLIRMIDAMKEDDKKQRSDIRVLGRKIEMMQRHFDNKSN